MSAGLAGVLPAAAREEGDIVEQPSYEYLWSDLKARRNALSVWPEDLAPLYELDLTRYRTYESGARDLLGPGRGLVDELIAMEAFVTGEANRLIDEAPAEGTVVLNAVIDQETFSIHFPDAHHRGNRNAYPMTLQHVAVGRVAAELRRQGRDVEVYRGERHFDLTAARLAVGLGKTETAHLLGLNVKSYFKTERGTDPPRRASLHELQQLDDFITDTAGRFEVSGEDGGAGVICVVDDQTEFEQIYPEARFQRSDTPYPVRMLWVAAGRRAGALAAAGQPARIAVLD